MQLCAGKTTPESVTSRVIVSSSSTMSGMSLVWDGFFVLAEQLPIRRSLIFYTDDNLVLRLVEASAHLFHRVGGQSGIGVPHADLDRARCIFVGADRALLEIERFDQSRTGITAPESFA